MANLLEIGKSGLLNYRQALGVTSENIANVNTEGYHRRSVESTEMLASVATPTTTSNGGQGVKVDSIKRAFDQLIQERARLSSSALSSAETFAPYVQMLEERLTPGTGGLTEMLDGFFQGLGAVALSPNDNGLRRAAIESAKGFADTVSDTAQSMEGLKAGIITEAENHIDRSNAILKSLSELQNTLLSVKDTGVRNPILDERDRLINELSDIMDIQVEITPKGMTKVTMGETAGGPVLLNGVEYARLSLEEDLRVSIDPYGVGGAVQTRRPTNGALHGLYTALGAVTETLSDFNTWTQNLVADFNAEHRTGLDAANRPGGDLFSLVGWEMTASDLNQGSASAKLLVTAHDDMPTGPLKMVYDGDAGLWNTYDADDQLLTQASTGASLPGVSIEMDGAPRTGDVFFINRTDGDAINLHFVPTETSQLAMASALRVSADTTNTGTSQIAVRASDVGGITTAPDLSADFGTATTLLDAVEFINGGTVGFIPSSATSVSLLSMAGQSEVEFATPTPAAMTSLVVDFDGQSYVFDLTTDQDGAPITPPTTPDDLAAVLNNGTVVALDASGQQTRFADLGIYASGQTNVLRLSSARGPISAGSTLEMASGAMIAPVTISDYNPASDMMIFTREGRQISGPVLSKEQAALLLTPANGFLNTALYNTETLNKADGYRGLTMTRSTSLGDFTAALGAGGAPVSFDMNAGLPAPIAPINFELWIEGDAQGAMTLPEGASAERMAQMIDEAYGVSVAARTSVEVTAPSDGTLRFSLMGDNIAPLQLQAKVENGSMADIVAAVNVLSGQTGITAEMSQDGGRMVLTHPSGENIYITNLVHSAGDLVNARRVDATGLPIDPAATQLGGVGTGSARFFGSVTLQSQSGFDFALDGVGATAVQSAAASGLVGQRVSAAGTIRDLTFSFDAFADKSITDSATADLAAAGVSFQMALTDAAGTVHAFDYATLGMTETSDLDLATSILATLRADAPTSRLQSAPLAKLPADGSGFSVHLGDQTYDVTMVAGAPVVTGPEANRITATFTAAQEFVLETTQGTLDGGMLVLSSNYRAAADFGLGLSDAPHTQMTGGVIDSAALTAGSNPFDVMIGDQTFTLDAVKAGGSVTITTPAGFPGTATFDAAEQKFSLLIDARAGRVSVPPSTTAQAVGFYSYGLTGSLGDTGLTLRSTTGDVIDLTITANSAAGTRLTMTNLPDEELIVVMRDPGALRLAGAMEVADQTDVTQDRPIRIEVVDATSGEIEIYDAQTGHSIATRWLDAKGTLQVAGYDITLTAGLQNGDSFLIEANLDGVGDGRIAENILDLRTLNESTGRGGFGTLFMAMLSEVGGRVRASNDKIDSARAVNDTAQRMQSEVSGVDLDTEAANLIQQQQAYQANAQVISVARQLFETLINAV